MSERSIDDLLGELPKPVVPRPDFDARLRQHLTAELRSNSEERTTTPHVDRSEPTEVIDLEATTAVRTKGVDARWLRAAAVIVVVAIGAAAAVVATRDDGRSASTFTAPDATFVGAELESIALSSVATTDPYFIDAARDTWVLSLTGDLVRVPADGAPEVVARVPDASPLAVDDGAVWIADAVDGRVLRLDPTDGSVVAEVETGVAINPPAFRIPMPEGAAREFSNLGGIVSNGASVWVGDKAGRVLRIDPASNEVVDTFDVPVRPDQLQLDGGNLLVVNLTGGEVAVVDSANGDVVHDVREVDELAGAALLGQALYLQDARDGVVTRIDIESRAEHSSAPLGSSLDLTGQPVRPTGLLATANGLLVDTSSEPNSLHVLDPETLRETGTLAVDADHGDMTLAPDGSVWLVRANAQTVVHITPRPL